MKKQKKISNNKLIIPKMIMHIFALSSLIACGSDETETPDTTNPIVVINSVIVKDLDNDGKLNDAEITVTATDNVGVEHTDVSVGDTPASKMGTKYVVQNLEPGKHTAKVEVVDTSGNPASAEKEFTVPLENIAPTAVVEFDDFSEHAPIGTVVGTVTVSDENGDTINTSLEEGGADFELELQTGQTNVYDIKTKRLFNYEEAADNEHDIKVKVIDAALFNEISAKANEIDKDEAAEAVDLPDLTYTKSLDDTEVTEEVSYTTVNSDAGVPIEVKIDKADNDPSTTNDKHYLLSGFDADGKPMYETEKQAEVDYIKGLGLGDALQLNVASTYENGGYGISKFTKTKVSGNTTLVNQHAETVSMEGYRKGVEILRDKLGINDLGFSYAPNFAPNTGNNTKVNWQIARASLIEMGKKEQQTGADTEDNVANWTAEAFTRVYHMPASERRKLFVGVYGEAAAVKYWD